MRDFRDYSPLRHSGDPETRRQHPAAAPAASTKLTAAGRKGGKPPIGSKTIKMPPNEEPDAYRVGPP